MPNDYKLDPRDSAFPIAETDELLAQLGLTKREWFIGMAMQGLCARMGGNSPAFDIGELAIEVADAAIDAANR